MVLEKEIKEVKKKEESVLKFLMKDFYELEAILSLIKEAEKEKTEGNLGKAKTKVEKALKRLRGGFGGETRIERRLARTFQQLKKLIKELEPFLVKRHTADLKEINTLIHNAEVYNADLEKLGSRKGGIQNVLEDAKKEISHLDKISTTIKQAEKDVQAFEVIINLLLKKEKLLYEFEVKQKEQPIIHEPPLKIMTSEETRFDLNESLTNIRYDGLKYALEVTLVGFLTALDDHDSLRVAAIIKTKDGKTLRVFNDYNHFLGHAEVEGIVKMKKEGLETTGAEVYVTDQCCYFFDKYEIIEKGNVTEEIIIETTDIRDSAFKAGDKVIREVIKKKEDGDRLIIKENYIHPRLGKMVREIIETPIKNGYLLTYIYKGVEIPREYVKVYQKNGKKFGERHRGCAVTLSFNKVGQINYVLEEELYGQGNSFCNSYGIKTEQIGNKKLRKICQIIKDDKIIYNSQDTDIPKKERIRKFNVSAQKFNEAIENLLELDRVFGYSILKGYKRIQKMFSDMAAYKIEVVKEEPTKIEKKLRESLHKAMKARNQLEMNVIRNVLTKIKYAELERRKEQIGSIHPGRIETELVKIRGKISEEEILVGTKEGKNDKLGIIPKIIKENEKIIEEDFKSSVLKIKEIQEKYASADPEEKALLEEQLRVIEHEVSYGQAAASKPINEKSNHLISLIYENILLKSFLPQKYTEEELKVVAQQVIRENLETIEKLGPKRAVGKLMGTTIGKYGKGKIDPELLRNVLTGLLAAA
ncbi:hypothetical protein HON71_02040 [Candidatus Woesearchaeota archaeon]|nr:hypothetical protein [Candidatus Woesearchaeota archaeon]